MIIMICNPLPTSFFLPRWDIKTLKKGCSYRERVELSTLAGHDSKTGPRSLLDFPVALLGRDSGLAMRKHHGLGLCKCNR